MVRLNRGISKRIEFSNYRGKNTNCFNIGWVKEKILRSKTGYNGKNQFQAIDLDYIPGTKMPGNKKRMDEGSCNGVD